LAIAEAQQEYDRSIDRCPSRAFGTSAASPYAHLMERKVRKEIEHMTTILLVDDNPKVADQLVPFLERFGFTVDVAFDGEAALQHIQTCHPDLIVLDVLMPKVDGYEVLRQLRQARNETPVILLSEVGDAVSHTRTLDEGADDYLNKPFDPHELRARIDAVLRRVRSGPRFVTAPKVRSGDLVLDRAAHRVWLKGHELGLTHKAIYLLDYLMTHPAELFTSERLLDILWGWGDPTGTGALRTRIAELRHVLGDNATQPQYIETVPGEGYRFIGKVEVAS
jgi:DNA-binding response OmpR family regulator